MKAKELLSLSLIIIGLGVWFGFVNYITPDTLGSQLIGIIIYLLGGYFFLYKLLTYFNKKWNT